ncbi:MAG: 30S ribosomal protein S16 [bacterium]
MAVRIRLKRMGKPHRPFYRIVVIHKGDTKDGNVIEVLGDYNPLPNPSVFNIDKEKALDWIKKGATPSKTVEKLLKKAQTLNS